MPRAIAFLSKCLKEQTTVIGASSLANDSSRAHYKKWVELPYITHESFATSLKNVLTNSDISGIYLMQKLNQIFLLYPQIALYFIIFKFWI